MDIDYDWYKIFYSVANCKNITLAAEQLYISQPAVSQCIHQLEENIGCQLFVRKPKGVTLTAEGEVLYEYISNGIKSFDSGERKLQSMLELNSGKIRIGASDMTLEYCLLPYLESFHKKFPNIKIEITNNPTPQTISLLKKGVIDFALVSEPVIIENKFDVIPVKKIEDIFICGNSCNIDNVYVNELPSDELILLEKCTSTRQYIESEFEKRNYLAHPKFELATSPLLVRFAEKNLGISCVVSDFAKDAIAKGTVRKINVKDPLKSRNICIVKSTDEKSVATSKLLEIIVNSD
ncbi:MAG: LysR family transcriptional regulator [Clostridiales bacterium]|nr:LysR family transcriptional regulator [Clostridiales bacterium]